MPMSIVLLKYSSKEYIGFLTSHALIKSLNLFKDNIFTGTGNLLYMRMPSTGKQSFVFDNLHLGTSRKSLFLVLYMFLALTGAYLSSLLFMSIRQMNIYRFMTVSISNRANNGLPCSNGPTP